MHLREKLTVQAKRLDQVAGPVPATRSNSKVPEASEGSVANTPVSRKAGIILGLQTFISFFVHLRLVLFDPEQLGSRVGRAEALPGQVVKRLPITERADPFRLERGALISPDNGPAQWRTLPVHQQRALHGPAETDRRDTARLDAVCASRRRVACQMPFPNQRVLFGQPVCR